MEDEILENVVMFMFDVNTICFKRKVMDTIIQKLHNKFEVRLPPSKKTFSFASMIAL